MNQINLKYNYRCRLPTPLSIRVSGTIIDELNEFDAFMNVNDNGSTDANSIIRMNGWRASAEIDCLEWNVP